MTTVTKEVTPETAPETVDPFAALESPQEHEGDPFSPADIPEPVKRFVARGHELWKQKPRKWWAVNLGSEAEVKRITRFAKSHARQAGLVFRVKNTTSKHMLVYRVTPVPPVKTEAAPPEQQAESAE